MSLVTGSFWSAPPRAPPLVLGKALSAGVRGLAQGIIIYSLALMLRIHLDFSASHVAGVAIFIILGSALFSTFSLAVACLVKTRERFMGIDQVLTMPSSLRAMQSIRSPACPAGCEPSPRSTL